MQQFKTAVFGTGFVGRVHLEGIRRLGNVELYAIGEPQIEKANQLAAEFGVPKTEADYRRILEDPAVDAVHICTPNALHFPMAKDALQAGKHVICEKPLATSVDEARELVALAAETKRRNATFHNLRFYPMVQHMRRMREDGDLGDILRRAGHLLAGLAALRHRLELAHRFEGERPLALSGRYRLALVRYGGARHRAADHVRLRRPADVPQDPQAAEGSDRNVRRQDAAARGLRRRCRSTPRISARSCSAWATARAARSRRARFRRAARTA